MGKATPGMLDLRDQERSGWADQPAQDVEQCRKALSSHYDRAEAEQWLTKPHPMLYGQSPIGCIQGGETHRVMDVIRQLDTHLPRNLAFT